MFATLNLWILNWSSRFSACVTFSGYGRIYCLGQQWVEWVWIQCWSCILIDKYNIEMICIILITYSNLCFVYQLLFNRMKQITLIILIDVYDFDFADTIWNENDIIYNCKNCNILCCLAFCSHVWLQSLFLLSISFVFFLFVLLFITFFLLSSFFLYYCSFHFCVLIIILVGLVQNLCILYVYLW